ncbi:hydrogenase formation protein HypD [Clostridium sp. YIM B02551]|uniref:hydrogenase formation protein HypD n=1 Tax=Clostridium sp. YIM B02551 TaxID=2910679 RepID=UPI001EEA43DA|nr:hydrogenase formation protein HypD [Clostridium sp. YIM B02551]
MKFIDEYRNQQYAGVLVKEIEKLSNKEITIMEVCGTHTMSIFKYGIKNILPKNIKIISGPGCPVCVTPESYIDIAINLSKREDVIIATFGDMIRVPGKEGTLLNRKSIDNNIRIVYSSMDAINIAINNPYKKVVFLSLGFEATTPMAALTAIEVKNRKINNFLFLTSHRKMPPIIEKLSKDPELKTDGYLLPGHVCAIAGIKEFEDLSSRYKIPGVVTGFEPIDILQGIKNLVEIVNKNEARVINEYKRVVREKGNENAQKYINKVFKSSDGEWRGIGRVIESEFVLKDEYEAYDAIRYFNIEVERNREISMCRCGEILTGKITPKMCPLFRKVCTPENPVGACMVSTEGTCSAYYKYS